MGGLCMHEKLFIRPTVNTTLYLTSVSSVFKNEIVLIAYYSHSHNVNQWKI